MCGIAGIIHFDSGGFDVGALERMGAAMHMRGPDDEGYAVFPSMDARGTAYSSRSTPPTNQKNTEHWYPSRPVASVTCKIRVGLVHTRLSIVDLSPTGYQPMSTRDRRY